MIYVGLGADLNMEDDDGRNSAAVPAGAPRPEVGSAIGAGRSKFWSWVVNDAVDENLDGTADVTFHQARSTPQASDPWWPTGRAPADHQFEAVAATTTSRRVMSSRSG